MLIATEKLAETLQSTILSARVARHDSKPVSLFLVAPPERGKTSLVVAHCGSQGLILTDITGMGVLEALQREPTATHVVINDLMAVSGHKQEVSKLTISILNALAEEGTYKIASPRLAHLDLSGRRVGIIACCTPDIFRDNRNWWNRSGFASRLLVLQYDHSPELTIKILQMIANDTGKHKKIVRSPYTLKPPEKPQYVKIGSKLSRSILDISQQVANHHNELGYRKEKQLRSLAFGHALLRSPRKPEVTREDVAFLESILPFVIVQNGQGVLLG